MKNSKIKLFLVFCLLGVNTTLFAKKLTCKKVVYAVQTAGNHAMQYKVFSKRSKACQRAVNELIDDQGRNVIKWIRQNEKKCKNLRHELNFFSLTCGRLKYKY